MTKDLLYTSPNFYEIQDTVKVDLFIAIALYKNDYFPIAVDTLQCLPDLPCLLTAPPGAEKITYYAHMI